MSPMSLSKLQALRTRKVMVPTPPPQSQEILLKLNIRVLPPPSAVSLRMLRSLRSMFVFQKNLMAHAMATQPLWPWMMRLPLAWTSSTTPSPAAPVLTLTQSNWLSWLPLKPVSLSQLLPAIPATQLAHPLWRIVRPGCPLLPPLLTAVFLPMRWISPVQALYLLSWLGWVLLWPTQRLLQIW